MALLKESTETTFDTSQISAGDLIYCENKNWPVTRSGIVTDVKEKAITVLFHPNIMNVYNRFVISASEVSEGQWLIRWSGDLKTINSYDTSSTTEATSDEA